MGKRKIALRKKNPDRHKAYLRIREKDTSELFTMSNGAQVVINPMKKFLLKEKYAHSEFKAELLRLVTKFSLGEKKYNEVIRGEN